MHESTNEIVWAEALFVSDIQEGDAPDGERVRRTVESVLRRDGPDGCAAEVAYEFGEHPDTAARRMAWALRMVRALVRSAARRAA
ncbi:MAG TPA: hypothetical protein VNV66_14590 [Pilimelia sp.]|nr:hypothetical protein [Pilimelia sp.]